MHRSAVLVALLALPSPARAQPADLYFSEYVEGSGNNKALEIVNRTGATVSLAGYEVRFYFNGSASPGASIALAGSVAAGDVFVLAHAASDPAILAQADQTGGGTWFNGDDAVALLKDGAMLDVIGQIGFDPGTQWGAGDASTADNTLRRLASVRTGDPDGSDAFDPAAQWAGFPTDTFSGLGQYPDATATAMPLTIPQIQGAGHTSPYVNAAVQTTGVVTAVALDGFYLQDPRGDGDALTSDGLFVFTAAAPAVSAGDEVQVTAIVGEYQPGGPSTENLTVTELDVPVVQPIASGLPLPAPVILGAAGSLPPTEVIEDDGLAVFDPATDGLDFYEPFEGMRVLVDDPLAVSAKNPFGEIVTVTDHGACATGLDARSGLASTAGDFNPERIRIRIEPEFTPGFDPSVTTGDTLGDVVGVLGYDFGDYVVRATQPFSVTPAGLQQETAPPAAGDEVLSIACFNLHNLDPKVEDPALVGSFLDIDDDVGDGQFARLGAEIAQNLRAPDILSVEEIQDDDGAEQTSVTDASLTFTTLLDAVAAAGGPAYEFRDIAPVAGTSGGQPGGNIRVGLLFNPARVTLDETSLAAIVDPDLGDGDAFADSRHPLAARFEFRGRKLTVIANHFASKSGSTPLFGQVQPPVNGAVEKRIAQAEVVHDVVAGLLDADPAANVVVLGDLNEFSFNEPLAVLEGQPVPILTDLSQTLRAVERYSFVFEGNSQDLDHILASDALVGLADYDNVHVNAEFEDPPSDHDPVLARLAFAAVCQPDLGFGGPGTATLSVCGDPLGPTGTATLALNGLPPGATGLLFFGPAAGSLATHGGVLVPQPTLGAVALIDTDFDGTIALAIPGALADVPVSAVIQFVYFDAALPPHGCGFSNAVKLQFTGP